MARVPDTCEVKITWHARQRAVERFGTDEAERLPQTAREARRVKRTTRDGLRVWHARGDDDRLLVLLVLEKTAHSLGGLYEAEVITVITRDMAQRSGIL